MDAALSPLASARTLALLVSWLQSPALSELARLHAGDVATCVFSVAFRDNRDA